MRKQIWRYMYERSKNEFDIWEWGKVWFISIAVGTLVFCFLMEHKLEIARIFGLV